VEGGGGLGGIAVDCRQPEGGAILAGATTKKNRGGRLAAGSI